MKYISAIVLTTFMMSMSIQEVTAQETRKVHNIRGQKTKDISTEITKKLQKQGIGIAYDEERTELKLVPLLGSLPMSEFAKRIKESGLSKEIEISAFEIRDPIGGIDSASDRTRDAYINNWHDRGFIVADIQIRNNEDKRMITLLPGDYESLDILVGRVNQIDLDVVCSGMWFKTMSSVPKRGPNYLPQPEDWVHHY